MSFYKKYIGDLFLTLRFYLAMGSCAVLYAVSFFYEFLFGIAGIVFVFLLLLILIDYCFLFIFFKAPSAERIIHDRLSNGEENEVTIVLKNRMPFKIKTEIIDELPEQFAERNFIITRMMEPREEITVKYLLTPVQRGIYYFGNILVFSRSLLGMVKRRTATAAEESVQVYPSFTGLGRYRLLAQATINENGSKQVRKIGHSMEFEQIKDYVTGDDIRNINWKATARKGGLMVNSYVDERSQQVYCVIDKGRLMRMPFKGLSLLDYAINATLALSNVCLQKQDRIGLISFSDKAGTTVAADRKPVQRENIMQALYKENTDFKESDYEMLYLQVRKRIKQRSLIILFTNFESLNGLKRQVNYLRSIAKHHLLLVIFFENTELTKLAGSDAKNTDDVYVKTIADKFAYEKRMVVKELQQYGIISVLTAPENLTVNAVNKYLELKSRQAL